MVPEEGSITARSSGPWLWPRGGWVEAAKSHPLVPTGHGGQRPPATLTGLLPGDFKSFYFNIIDNITQHLTTPHNT